MEEKLSFSNFYRHPRFWRHLGMWAIMYVFFIVNVLIMWFEKKEEFQAGEEVDLIFFLLELKLLVYGCFYVYNKLQPQRKYWQMFVCFALLIIGVSLLDHYTESLVITIGDLKGFWANLVVYPMIVLVAFGFKLAYHGVKQVFVIQKLEKEKMESELKLLKSQVNPHFLFNTLNNIYSTNLDDHDKANDMILGLADLLRYQLESNKQNFTILETEIRNLEHYVEMEKIRVRDCDLSIEKEGDFSEAKIAPLLLLPFVENAFKYGTGIQKGEISIRYELKNNKEFEFSCKNKIVQKDGKVHSGGIGLKNVQKRLELIYPNKYDLDIQHTDDWYSVVLKIDL